MVYKSKKEKKNITMRIFILKKGGTWEISGHIHPLYLALDRTVKKDQ